MTDILFCCRTGKRSEIKRGQNTLGVDSDSAHYVNGKSLIKGGFLKRLIKALSGNLRNMLVVIIKM